jgi:hypothetical protein
MQMLMNQKNVLHFNTDKGQFFSAKDAKEYYDYETIKT